MKINTNLKFLLILLLISILNNTFSEIVGYWDFNEGAGTTLPDLSKFQNHGFIYGATWRKEAFTGGSLFFDGQNDYILIPHSASLDVTKQLTIAVWVYPQSMPYSLYSHIVGKMAKEVGEGWKGSYWIPVHGSQSMTWGLGLSLNQGAIDHWARQNASMEEWSFLTITFDDVKDEMKLYLNSKLIRTYNERNDLMLNNCPVYMGRNNDYNAMRYFHGLIGDIKIYNNILSEIDIINLYNVYPSKPLLISAIASDGTFKLPGIDNDDNVIFTFQEKVDVRRYPINHKNIDSLLPLNNNHTWRCGFGTVNKIEWNHDSTKLAVVLNTLGGLPTISIGDTVSLSPSGNKVSITGSFGQINSIKNNFSMKSNRFEVVKNPKGFSFKFSELRSIATILIYSLKGSCVKKILVNRNDKIIHWDQTDNKGVPLSKGIYIINYTDNTSIFQKRLKILN